MKQATSKTTSKHTPGPYHVGGLLHNVKVSGYRIVGCGATVAIVVAGTGRAEETSDFLAAAPDLLAALRDLRAIIHDDLTHARQADHADAIQRAAAAITRAEGGAA